MLVCRGDGSPVHHSDKQPCTHTHIQPLIAKDSSERALLDKIRVEYPERAFKCTRRKCKVTEEPQAGIQTKNLVAARHQCFDRQPMIA